MDRRDEAIALFGGVVQVKRRPIRRGDRQHILENLGIPISPARIKCALLGLKTLKGAAWGLSEWPGDDKAASTARANGSE